MLTEKELEKAIEKMISRLDEVNVLFISKVAAQVKKIGELNQTSINRLILMSEMGIDIRLINERLVEATSLNITDLYTIYKTAMDDVYTDPRFKVMLDGNVDAPRIRERLTEYTRSVSEQTAGAMINLSNTTATSETYQQIVDKAVTAVSSGLTDYNSATRDAIRSLGYNGLQVYYESGYHRRLDTAVRQNIIDGANQIAQNGAKLIGDALEYDAFEISAHANSAPDHEPVQGRVFLRAEFERMQAGESFTDIDGRRYAGFRRPIAEWNCGHIATPFSTEHSTRRYTDEQLQRWARENKEGFEYNGKHYTIYQASQIMRQLETEVRRWKDTANAARAVNDDTLRRQCQKRINTLSSKYSQIADLSGLPTKRQRMSVEGFRAVKI